MKKILVVLVLMISVSMCLFSGGQDEQVAAGPKDTLVVAIGADVTSFDPHIGKETPAVAVTNHIYDTLVDIDSVTGEVIPQIAEKWDQVSVSIYTQRQPWGQVPPEEET